MKKETLCGKRLNLIQHSCAVAFRQSPSRTDSSALPVLHRQLHSGETYSVFQLQMGQHSLLPLVERESMSLSQRGADL